MNWLLTGASGFIGSHVARAAIRRGHSVRCLVRPCSDRSLLDGLAVEFVCGDMTDPDSLWRAAAGAEVVVHCAALTSESASDDSRSDRVNVLGTRHLVEACRDHRVARLVFISTQSASENNRSAYGRTKLAAERVVASSGLPFTILRPSTVYGPGARGLFPKMRRYVEWLPVIPLVGDGRQRFRPLYVDDLVDAILKCCESPETIGKTYDLGGRDGISFAEFVDGIAKLVGKRRFKLHLPVALCLAAARGLALVLEDPPLTVDNVLGLSQMRECDIGPAERDFGFRPRSFAAGMSLLRRAELEGEAAALEELAG